MMGVSKLNETMTTIFQVAFDSACEFELCTDFCYLYDEDVIKYALIENERGNKELSAYLKKRHNLQLTDEQLFVFSFLHEIGHEMTIDDLDDAQYNKAQFIKRIVEAPVLNRIPFIRQIYYGLYDEAEATAWAAYTWKASPNFMEELTADVMKAVNDFYKANIKEG